MRVHILINLGHKKPRGPAYQHIIITNTAAGERDRFTLANELSHIFFGTGPGENGNDPTSNADHSSIDFLLLEKDLN